MRILLDECVPARLGRELIGHEIRTVPELGWASKENGALLALAEGKFDVVLHSPGRSRRTPQQDRVPHAHASRVATGARERPAGSGLPGECLIGSADMGEAEADLRAKGQLEGFGTAQNPIQTNPTDA